MIHRVRGHLGATTPGHESRKGRGRSASRRKAVVLGQDDAGFSLIEVLVAFTVLAVVFVAVEGGAIGTVTASVTAAQRATATSLAAQAIAEAQALPFACLQAGLDTNLQTAEASWPEIVPSGSNYVLQLPGAGGPTSAGTILNNPPNSACNPSRPPLVPFSSVQRPGGGVSYNVAVFPTIDAANSNLVTVTAIVSWSAPPAHQQTTTIEQVEVGVQ
ncbi:MAG: type IV pilus modification PilV family protein [Acidimicrobiales bacterium]